MAFKILITVIFAYFGKNSARKNNNFTLAVYSLEELEELNKYLLKENNFTLLIGFGAIKYTRLCLRFLARFFKKTQLQN